MTTTIGFALACIALKSHAQSTNSITVLEGGDVQAKDASVVYADDFQNLQAAIDALPKAGGAVKLAAKTYEISQPIRIHSSDVALLGVGGASHINNQNKAGQPALVIENPEFHGKATPTKERLWRVSVSNLRITGNENSGHGIEAHYIEEILLDRVSISYHGGDGVHLNHCYEDPRLLGNLFTYNKGHGVYLLGCHDIVVSANQFEENQTGLACIDSFNLTMSGNNLDDHLGDGIVIENTYGSVVASNMIEECQGWAIVCDRDVYGTTFSANVIAHEFTGGIDLRDAHGCSVSGNTFTIVKKVGLRIGDKSGGITVTGNNFSDSWVGAGKNIRPDESTSREKKQNEAAGILLEGCEYIVISGNLFSGLSTPAVEQVGDCRNVLLQGNGMRRLEQRASDKQ